MRRLSNSGLKPTSAEWQGGAALALNPVLGERESESPMLWSEVEIFGFAIIPGVLPETEIAQLADAVTKAVPRPTHADDAVVSAEPFGAVSIDLLPLWGESRRPRRRRPWKQRAGEAHNR